MVLIRDFDEIIQQSWNILLNSFIKTESGTAYILLVYIYDILSYINIYMYIYTIFLGNMMWISLKSIIMLSGQILKNS